MKNQKKQLRFKTEQEFIDEYGGGWRCNAFVKDDVVWPLTMDYLFGTPHDESEVKNGWFIYDEMLTEKPLPKAKKLDAYIDHALDSAYVWIVFRRDNENEANYVRYSNLHKYNILSKSEYRAKYPNKLMFKGYEVKVYGEVIEVECETATKEQVQRFMKVCAKCEKHDISPDDLYYFIDNHKKELGL